MRRARARFCVCVFLSCVYHKATRLARGGATQITFVAGVIQRQWQMIVGLLVDVIVALGAQKQDGNDDHWKIKNTQQVRGVNGFHSEVLYEKLSRP